ncbi:putative glycosyl transferase [Streptococcus parauberis]|nr:putative glycosyl transferase [Streptococcus parauberis]
MFYLNDYIFKYVDKVVTLSNEMKTFILDNRNFSEVNVEVIPNWSTEDISKVPIKEIENKKFLISYFGNIGIAQDFDSIKFALKYFSGNPIIQWSFAGHGTYYNNLIDYTITNNIDNVTFNGYLNQEELNRLASISNCFLLSLKKELAGLAVPSKYYTYLNYNKPIIAIISKKTDIFKEINQYKLGVAIKNEDKNCLVQTIEKLSKSYSNFNNLYVYKEFYEPDVQLLKYSQMIKSLIRDIE